MREIKILYMLSLMVAVMAMPLLLCAEESKAPAAVVKEQERHKLADQLEQGLVCSVGSANAPVSMYVFTSFTCAYCKRFQNIVWPAIKKYCETSKKAKVAFIHLPSDIIALDCARLIHCAKPEMREPLIQTLFDKQEYIVRQQHNYLAAVEDLARFGRVSKEEFTLCRLNKTLKDKLYSGYFLLERFKIDSSPTIIVNNKPYEGPLRAKEVLAAIEKSYEEVVNPGVVQAEKPTPQSSSQGRSFFDKFSDFVKGS